MKALADVEPAVGHARRREGVFHLAAVVEGPAHGAGRAIQAVERPGLVLFAVDRADVNRGRRPRSGDAAIHDDGLGWNSSRA